MNRRAFLTSLGAATVLLGGCLGGSSGYRTDPLQGEWSSFQYDDHNVGHNPDQPDGTPELDVAYELDLSGGIPYAPVVDDDTGLFTAGETIHAIETSTGATEWTTDLGDVTGGSIRLQDDAAFVGHRSGGVRAVRPDDGSTIWQRDLSGAVHSSPAVATETVLVGGDDDRLYALDVASGDTRWTARTSGNVACSPVVADGVAYVTSWGDNVYALDVEDGSRRWHRSLEALGSPVLAGDSLLVVGGTDEHGFVSALDPASGKTVWTRSPFDLRASATPAARNDVCVVASEGGVIAGVDRSDGEVRWRTDANDGIRQSPVVVRDTAFVASRRGTLYAIDVDTGNIRETYVLENPNDGTEEVVPSYSLSVVDGHLFVGTLVTTAGHPSRLTVFSLFES